MRAGIAAALLFVLVLDFSGCLGAGPPKVVVEDLYTRTESTYRPDPGVYEVHLQGRVANHGSVQARGTIVLLGVGDGCVDKPALPGRFDFEALAPESSSSLEGMFTQAAPAYRHSALWYEVRVGDGRALTDHGCDALPVERAP